MADVSDAEETSATGCLKRVKVESERAPAGCDKVEEASYGGAGYCLSGDQEHYQVPLEAVGG